MGDQVIAPPSMSVDERTGFPAWADEPSFDVESFVDERFVDEPFGAEESYVGEPTVAEPLAADGSTVSREEAIAEVLRAALAEGHSDDALAGILRKVVAGDSPQAALAAEPDLTEIPAVEVASAPADVGLPDVELPAELSAAEPPADDLLVAGPAVPQFDLFSPVTAPPAPAVPATVQQPPVQLWGEVAIPAPAPRSDVAADARIWADSVPAEPAPAVGTSLAGALQAGDPVFGDASTETPVAPAADEIAADATLESAETAAPESLDGVPEPALDLEVAPVLARTASDPAPSSRSMSMDATTVMPPLSLLPGASRGRGLPPVPPRTGRPPVPPSQSREPGAPSPGAADTAATAARTSELLATVTRLPVAPLVGAPETPDVPELAGPAELMEADGSTLLDTPDLPAAVPARPTRVPIAPPTTPAEVVSRLTDLGVPADLLGGTFTADVVADGTYAALTRALGDRLPEAPELPTGAGDVLFVVGPGVETLRAARSLAATLRLDPDRVQWATRGDLVGLAPETSRMSTIDAALRRRQDASATGTVTIVAVDAPLRTDAYWMAQMLAIWSPVAVWAVVEATRKPEDLEHWIDGLARVDALIVQDTDLSADPAAVLHRLAAPVAVVDGVRATPHRWASVLCERLESAPA